MLPNKYKNLDTLYFIDHCITINDYEINKPPGILILIGSMFTDFILHTNICSSRFTMVCTQSAGTNLLQFNKISVIPIN